MEHGTHDIKKEVEGYLIVFGALLFFTIVTVAISYLHLPTTQAIVLALIVATIKASLVCLYFMHLISEEKFIYYTLAMVIIFFFALLLLPMIEAINVITGTTHVS